MKGNIQDSIMSDVPDYVPGRGVYLGIPFRPKESAMVTISKADYEYLLSENMRLLKLSSVLAGKIRELCKMLEQTEREEISK